MSTYLRKIVNISDEQVEAIRLATKRRYESAMINPYNKRRGRPPNQKNNKAIKQGGRRRKRSRRKSHGQSTETLDGSIDLSRPSSSSFCCPRKPRPFYCKRNIDMDQLPLTERGREQIQVVSNLPPVEGREQLLAITNLVMMSDSQNDDVFVYQMSKKRLSDCPLKGST